MSIHEYKMPACSAKHRACPDCVKWMKKAGEQNARLKQSLLRISMLEDEKEMDWEDISVNAIAMAKHALRFEGELS